MTRDLLVLDVDPRHGGGETVAQLERQLGALPETPTVETGGGGRHYYFGAVAGPLRGALGPGVDVKRGRGSYVVAPPSPHASGRRYVWAAASAPDEIAELPGAWLARLRRQSAPVRTTVPARVGHLPEVAERVRRARAYVARLPIAVSGEGGHAALWRASLAVVRGFGLDGDAAMVVLTEYSARCLPPWSERDVQHKIVDAQRADVPHGYLLRGEVRHVA